MNERIQQLAEQAGYEKDMFGIGHWDMPECKKFAQLIVQECAELAKKKAFIIMQKAEENYSADKKEEGEYRWVMVNATSAAFHLEILEQEIREHFGVEE